MAINEERNALSIYLLRFCAFRAALKTDEQHHQQRQGGMINAKDVFQQADNNELYHRPAYAHRISFPAPVFLVTDEHRDHHQQHQNDNASEVLVIHARS